MRGPVQSSGVRPSLWPFCILGVGSVKKIGRGNSSKELVVKRQYSKKGKSQRLSHPCYGS